LILQSIIEFVPVEGETRIELHLGPVVYWAKELEVTASLAVFLPLKAEAPFIDAENMSVYLTRSPVTSFKKIGTSIFESFDLNVSSGSLQDTVVNSMMARMLEERLPICLHGSDVVRSEEL
jgi:hypothetical protein